METCKSVRLNVEIKYNSFVIHDPLSGGTVLFKDDCFQAFNLDRDMVVQRMASLQSSLLTAKKSTALLGMSLTRPSEEVIVSINDDGVLSWTIYCDGKTGILQDGKLKTDFYFNSDLLLSKVNWVVFNLVRATRILQPRTDIVRRIPDAHLVVWVWNGHSVVCYEDGINGVTMDNCLIDGKSYDLVLVQADETTGTCTLISKDFKMLAEFPLDDSIQFFYKDEKNIAM